MSRDRRGAPILDLARDERRPWPYALVAMFGAFIGFLGSAGCVAILRAGGPMGPATVLFGPIVAVLETERFGKFVNTAPGFMLACVSYYCAGAVLLRYRPRATTIISLLIVHIVFAFAARLLQRGMIDL